MMSQSQYSLTWEAHVRNVCDGLCTLQQNGEFVDMTLAADGHMVKVHQIVLALASPYFKDLIISAQCPHPVIYLNKVKHPTLSAILEYIYTGEVLVSLEHLNDLVEAAKDLHIKGLKDMKVHPAVIETSKDIPIDPPTTDVLNDNKFCFFQVAEEDPSLKETVTQDQDEAMQYNTNIMQFSTAVYDDEGLIEGGIAQEMQSAQYIEDGQHMQSEEFMQETQDMQAEHTEGHIDDMHSDQTMETGNDLNCGELTQSGKESASIPDDEMVNDTDSSYSYDSTKGKVEQTTTMLQYTVSNQGSLQMILNRFMYYLKHTNRDNSRQWRCVDYLSHVAKCPAHVITKDDIVVQRIEVHTHPFHDKKILKKLKSGSIYSAIMHAEREGRLKKKNTDDPILESDDSRIE